MHHYNDKLYLYIEIAPGLGAQYRYIMLELPVGNYTGASLATAILSLLSKPYAFAHSNELNSFTCDFIAAQNIIRITNTSGYAFQLITDGKLEELRSQNVPFTDINDNVIPLPTDLNSINDLLRNSVLQPAMVEYESNFLDLVNTHSIYIHSPNLGFHYNTIGCKGENSIIKKVPVSSSFGYLILDSVVAPHDKIDVSRQTLKTMHFTLKNVHGNTINLHGGHVSFSLILQTME